MYIFIVNDKFSILIETSRGIKTHLFYMRFGWACGFENGCSTWNSLYQAPKYSVTCEIVTLSSSNAILDKFFVLHIYVLFLLVQPDYLSLNSGFNY